SRRLGRERELDDKLHEARGWGRLAPDLELLAAADLQRVARRAGESQAGSERQQPRNGEESRFHDRSPLVAELRLRECSRRRSDGNRRYSCGSRAPSEALGYHREMRDQAVSRLARALSVCAERHGLDAAYLFGSVARGEGRRGSDLDVAVLYRE